MAEGYLLSKPVLMLCMKTKALKICMALTMILTLLSACNNSASIENQADSLGKKIDSFGKDALDSGKVKMRNLKKTIQEKLGKKDSSDK